MLDGAGLMDTHMPGISGDHTLVWHEQRRNHDGIRLCPADEEEDIRLRLSDRRTDLLLRRSTIFIIPIAGLRHEIRLEKTRKNLRMRTGVVVIFKR